jgi:hypothetical protein
MNAEVQKYTSHKAQRKLFPRAAFVCSHRRIFLLRTLKYINKINIQNVQLIGNFASEDQA